MRNQVPLYRRVHGFLCCPAEKRQFWTAGRRRPAGCLPGCNGHWFGRQYLAVFRGHPADRSGRRDLPGSLRGSGGI